MIVVLFAFLKENAMECLALFLSVIGGLVGLRQWIKGNDYKRAEIAKELIIQIQDDKEIAFIIDCVDWADGFTYDGLFHISNEKLLTRFKDEQSLFIAIDRTLAHFNYICYLYSLFVFKKKDMVIFDYEIRRLFDNHEVCNYLHSLSLWSKHLRVSCPYSHLIRYAKKRKFVFTDFGKEFSDNYIIYLDHIGE